MKVCVCFVKRNEVPLHQKFEALSPRKTRSLTILKETVVVGYDGTKDTQGPHIEDPAVQSLLDLRKGSKASRLESLRQKRQPVVGEGSSTAHSKYYSLLDTDNLSNDNPDGDDDAARSSRRNRPPVVIVQDDPHTMQPMDQADIHIDKDENHILGPSTVAIAKKFKELIQKDEITIADFKGTGLEQLKYKTTSLLLQSRREVALAMLNQFFPFLTGSEPSSLLSDYTYLVDLNTEEKYTTSITKHYVVRYYKEGIEDRNPERWSKEVCRYHFEALNAIHHWEEDNIDCFKSGMSVVTEGNIYSDLRIKSVV
ncbi:hypothetical protein Tco_0888533 [Tanacetum coccineum]